MRAYNFFEVVSIMIDSLFQVEGTKDLGVVDLLDIIDDLLDEIRQFYSRDLVCLAYDKSNDFILVSIGVN